VELIDASSFDIASPLEIGQGRKEHLPSFTNALEGDRRVKGAPPVVTFSVEVLGY
jgi:hypothetical protein